MLMLMVLVHCYARAHSGGVPPYLCLWWWCAAMLVLVVVVCHHVVAMVVVMVVARCTVWVAAMGMAMACAIVG